MSSSAGTSVDQWGAAAPVRFVVDGHVHFYDCHSLPAFLDAAVTNLGRLAGAAGMRSVDVMPCLLMTESVRDHAFRRLCDGSLALPGHWSLRSRPCSASLRLAREDGAGLYIVAGRQVATAERLEVLAIGCDATVPDGRPIRETIASVREAGAYPVIPWGFGKWWGARGRIVRAVLEAESPARLALGDNGGRLALGPDPELFTVGRRQGFHVFPGTDPLPFAGQECRVGSYGFVLEVEAGTPANAAGIQAALARVASSPERIGRRTGPLAFVNAQVRMQLKSRL